MFANQKEVSQELNYTLKNLRNQYISKYNYEQFKFLGSFQISILLCFPFKRFFSSKKHQYEEKLQDMFFSQNIILI